MRVASRGPSSSTAKPRTLDAATILAAEDSEPSSLVSALGGVALFALLSSPWIIHWIVEVTL